MARSRIRFPAEIVFPDGVNVIESSAGRRNPTPVARSAFWERMATVPAGFGFLVLRRRLLVSVPIGEVDYNILGGFGDQITQA